jgi:hypothetical protein
MTWLSWPMHGKQAAMIFYQRLSILFAVQFAAHVPSLFANCRK